MASNDRNMISQSSGGYQPSLKEVTEPKSLGKNLFLTPLASDGSRLSWAWGYIIWSLSVFSWPGPLGSLTVYVILLSCKDWSVNLGPTSIQEDLIWWCLTSLRVQRELFPNKLTFPASGRHVWEEALFNLLQMNLALFWQFGVHQWKTKGTNKSCFCEPWNMPEGNRFKNKNTKCNKIS